MWMELFRASGCETFESCIESVNSWSTKLRTSEKGGKNRRKSHNYTQKSQSSDQKTKFDSYIHSRWVRQTHFKTPTATLGTKTLLSSVCSVEMTLAELFILIIYRFMIWRYFLSYVTSRWIWDTSHKYFGLSPLVELSIFGLPIKIHFLFANCLTNDEFWLK